MRSLILCLLAVSLGACSSSDQDRNRQGYFFHTVSRDGETLSAISRWYTGASSNWPHLARHNPGLDPQRMRIGESVRIPKGWLVTTRPMPYYTVQRPPARRPPLPAAPQEMVLPQGPTSDAAGMPQPQDDWTAQPAQPDGQAAPPSGDAGASKANEGDPDAEARRKQIRDKLLDEMLDE